MDPDTLRSHRLGGDFNLEKLSLSTQYRPGRMETSEAGPVGLQLEKQTKLHVKTR